MSIVPTPRSRGGPFICALCGRGFTRRATIKDPHHEQCVRKNGNPNGLSWDAHESCWLKNNKGPSGTIPPRIGHRYNDRGDQTRSHDEGIRGLIEGAEDHHKTYPSVFKDGLGETEEENQRPNYFPLTRLTPIRQQHSLETVSNRSTLSIKCSVSLLSVMTMNQLANLPITACRSYAARGLEEAYLTWKTWHNMLPEGMPSDVKQPQPEHTSLQRQQAVIWQAQKTYGALLNMADSLEQQLRLVTVWKNMLQALGDVEGLARMRDLLVRELGEEGPLLLGHKYCA